MKPDQVRQGESYDFTFPIADINVAGYTCQIDVKQYPDDASAISRAVTIDSNGQFKGTLTPAETLALNVGQYHLIATMTNATKEIEEVQRLSIQKKWV